MMGRGRGIAAALIALACMAGAARTARAATLNPFRAGAGDSGARAMDPFRRVAQALPGPPLDEEKPKPAEKKQTSTSASAAAAAAAAAKSCQRDEDCGEGNICQRNVCKAIELSTNLFPIYYREGSFKQIA